MTVKGTDENTAADIIKQINAKNAKIIACVIVVGFCFYHGILHVRYGIDSCKWLLSDGRYKGDMEWQPYGCMMHQYTLKDTRRCFRYLSFWGRRNHFVFLGDSHIQLHYFAFLHQLSLPKRSESSTWVHSKSNKTYDFLHQGDHNFRDSLLGLNVEFFWHPYVSDELISHFKKWVDDGPSFIVVGSGTWAIEKSNGSAHMLDQFTLNLTRLAKVIAPKPDRKVRVLWVPLPPVKETMKGRKEKSRPQILSNEHIDLYNKAAAEVLEHSGAQIWWSSRLLAQGRLEESIDAMYPGERAMGHNTQILLNAYCNDHMNYNDGTCCWSAEPYTTLQIITYSFFGVCMVIASAMVLYRNLRRFFGRHGVTYTALPTKIDSPGRGSPPPGPSNNFDLFTLLIALSKLGLIVAFFYMCDRTSFFMKENKYYSALSFWLPLGYMVVLGLFFTEDSRFTKVLHREQTDEWKGWMQLAILIYQMTDASGVLPVYMHIRVLVSAYLFLTGYGHFCYFWQRGEAGIVRFFQVFFRLNFLTVVLCLCMNRPYQFYHFVPLVSWWVFSIFLLLSLPPRVSAASSDGNPLQFLYLVLKFVGFISIITILYMSEVFFEKVFVTRPWKALFVTTDDDIHEWWFRWKLDRYSVSYGMMYAVVLFLAQRHQLLDDRNHSNLLSPRLSLLAVLAALGGLGGYAGFSLLCRNRQECNEIHPYVVFIPIVSYIALRNISGVLRTRYSTFFSWFGRISLELSICQYHIWLAADANGVLVLVPGYPVLNAIVISFIFICIAHEVHDITAVLTPYAVPSDWRKVVRNAVLFMLTLIPIGIHDGMF